MDDLYPPTIASRIYVYPHIAFYECISRGEPGFNPLAGKLNGLSKLPAPPSNIVIDKFIAACISFTYVGQNLVGSEYKLADWRSAFVDSLIKVNDTILVKNSVAYGHQVADSIINWTKNDNYLHSRGLTRFVLGKGMGNWQPTPADYAPAVEPHWNTIRPLTLTKPSQFSPQKKVLFSREKNSVFNTTMHELYDITTHLDSVKTAIAWYWDDNPNVSVVEGHLNYYIHKISPGGHWVMIAEEACRQSNKSLVFTSYACTLTSIALFDAFIACWDEKYKIDLIRPVTVINRYIDPKWQSLIQTPPFPEFTSGHAVISNAAATILTKLLGDNFSFTDEVEIPFGNKRKNFSSFYAAAYEASYSRVYGGIHYPATAVISIDQGKKIGNYIFNMCSGVTSK
jgi:hypothetical protein